MRRPGSPAVLLEEIARFQAEMQRLTWAAVRAVIAEELARRRARLEPARPRKGRPAQHAQHQLELGLAPAPQRQLELPLAQHAAHDAAPDAAPIVTHPDRERADAPNAVAVPAMATSPPEPPSGLPAGRPGRTRWTRESIVSELATWLLSGTAIDAQFLARYGPRGLVTAARRVFGRFEAALNVAALHNAKLYPDGPPARDAHADWPATIAAARRRAPM